MLQTEDGGNVSSYGTCDYFISARYSAICCIFEDERHLPSNFSRGMKVPKHKVTRQVTTRRFLRDIFKFFHFDSCYVWYTCMIDRSIIRAASRQSYRCFMNFLQPDLSYTPVMFPAKALESSSSSNANHLTSFHSSQLSLKVLCVCRIRRVCLSI